MLTIGPAADTATLCLVTNGHQRYHNTQPRPLPSSTRATIAACNACQCPERDQDAPVATAAGTHAMDRRLKVDSQSGTSQCYECNEDAPVATAAETRAIDGCQHPPTCRQPNPPSPSTAPQTALSPSSLDPSTARDTYPAAPRIPHSAPDPRGTRTQWCARCERTRQAASARPPGSLRPRRRQRFAAPPRASVRPQPRSFVGRPHVQARSLPSRARKRIAVPPAASMPPLSGRLTRSHTRIALPSLYPPPAVHAAASTPRTRKPRPALSATR